MPANVYWDATDSTIIIREMSGNWTWEEYFEAIQKVNQMIGEVEHRVDIIVDCRNMIQFPQAALPNIRSANKSYPDNMGIQVIVASNRIVEIFANMLQKTSPQMLALFIFKNTMDEAYNEIKLARQNSEATNTTD